MKILEVIRGLVRPILTFGIVGSLVALAIILALRYADKDVAIPLIMFLTGAGATILGYWFGERKAK